MSQVTILNRPEKTLSWNNVKESDIVIFKTGLKTVRALCIKFKEDYTDLALVSLDGHDIWDTFNPESFGVGSDITLLAHYNSGKVNIEFNLDEWSDHEI